MRGIVTLASAMALPAVFPYRDLIVLTALSFVFGTLVIQGLTLKPLFCALNSLDDDPVGREVRMVRERELRAGLASLTHDRSLVAEVVRRQLTASLTGEPMADTSDSTRFEHGEIHRGALPGLPERPISPCAHDEIGDDAFHQIEEELDWLEMASRCKAE